MRAKKQKRRELVSDLNITNLIDVILTLLIIFMITAPMMTQGVQVELPKAEAQNVEVNNYVQVSIDERNEIYIDDERTSLVDFRKQFSGKLAGRKDIPVFLNADKKVPYGMAVRVISEMQNAGANRLGFLTQPLDKKGSFR